MLTATPTISAVPETKLSLALFENSSRVAFEAAQKRTSAESAAIPLEQVI